MLELTKEALRDWRNALFTDSDHYSNEAVSAFRARNPALYYYLHNFYRLRSEMLADLRIFEVADLSIEWFTLTFDLKRDKSLVSSKRKSATRFLNSIFLFYEMVEEYGTENTERYHIHGFGVYRSGKSYEDFIKWPCRNKVRTLPFNGVKKKVVYLTKYAVKSLPRIRRSKNLCRLRNALKGCRIKTSFPELYKEHVKDIVLSLRSIDL